MSKSDAKDIAVRTLRRGYRHNDDDTTGTAICPLCRLTVTGYAHPSERDPARALLLVLFAHLYPHHKAAIT